MSDTATTSDIYAIPEELKDFRDTIREIVDGEIRPRAAEIDATGEYPWDVRKLLGEQDILGLPFAEEYGGTGTGTLMLQVAVEQIAMACASSALILMIQELGSLPITLFGSEPSSWIIKISALEAQALAISSTPICCISVPVPVPPYSEANGRPRMSCSPSSLRMSHGYSPVASISAARGRILPSTISRITSRKSRISCGSS